MPIKLTFKPTTYPNKSENPSNPEYPDNPQKSWGHRKVSHEVFHDNANYGSDHKNKVKQIPGCCEIVMPQTNYFNCGLCKK